MASVNSRDKITLGHRLTFFIESGTPTLSWKSFPLNSTGVTIGFYVIKKISGMLKMFQQRAVCSFPYLWWVLTIKHFLYCYGIVVCLRVGGFQMLPNVIRVFKFLYSNSFFKFLIRHAILNCKKEKNNVSTLKQRWQV
jgi:hypothetical protein